MVVRKAEIIGTAEEFRSGAGSLALWWGILAGPIAFALDEVISYATVQHSCSTGFSYWLHVYTALAIALSLSGLASAQWCYRHLPSSADTKGGSVDARSRWMSIYGTASSIAFLVVIIAMSIPKIIMSPCDQ
jgi:hypothetical protein